MPRIHLITYATPRFRLRQLLLGWSALLNHVADTVTAWTPDQLLKAGFEERCPGIKLTERGSGFWAWKPFIIDAKLRAVPDGDLVFYCDVGRLYPFKLLDQPVTPFIHWMDERNQHLMPGVKIPWDGPNSHWIKRDALVTLDMDRPEVHTASPVQASFSIWRAGPCSRAFMSRWLDLCAQRPLVSDDPSRGLAELSDFRGHRHDQALLSLCCLAEGVAGLSVGDIRPEIDTRNPSQIACLHFGESLVSPSLPGRILRGLIWPIERIEKSLRQKAKFGESTPK